MKISSDSFRGGDAIDARHAMKAIRGGQNISPHLVISGVPAGAKTLAVACIDRHPMAQGWVHWMAVNLPADTAFISEGASGKSMPRGSLELGNTFGAQGYGGPQPPRGSGRHAYEFTVYAVSEILRVADRRMGESELLELMRGKILANDSITGYFENK